MNIKQKRAIWYSVRDKEKRQREQILKLLELQEVFKNSRYKSLTWFLNSKGISIACNLCVVRSTGRAYPIDEYLKSNIDRDIARKVMEV